MMEAYDVAIVPLIVGVVELLKTAGLPNKLSAVVAAIMGIVVGIVYVHPGDIPKGVLVGLSLGLAASGLYSGVKNTKEIYKDK